MNERFLHYLWQHKYFYKSSLTTTNGETITIISPGLYNTDGGPDFLNAKIKIGDIEWAGNVEIHINASDWYNHKHQENMAYNNIVLHVVYSADVEVSRVSGEVIPTFELKGHFDESVYHKFDSLMEANRWIACEKQISDVPRITFELWLERLLIERIEEKSIQIDTRLQQNSFNWEQTFYESVASSFGLKVNAVPFELLAKSLPLSILQKHTNSLFQIEALLFGQAGMLNEDFSDDYPIKLQKEYLFLQTKYGLTPLEKSVWNFLRLRPSSFPTHRIAQLAQLLHSNNALFSNAVVALEVSKIMDIFQVSASSYWQTHYLFDKEANVKSYKLGSTLSQLILINSIAPFLFLYGRYYSQESMIKKAMDLHDLLAGEDNAVIRSFKQLHINTATAFRTQALLQLKKHYCDEKRCLECAIGNSIVKPEQIS